MIYLYDTLIYQPLLDVLVFLYKTVAFGDLGVAIIFLTILVRLILFPLFQKSVRHQSIMQRLQPKLKKVQEDHQNDKQKQLEATMALYKEHGVNPFGGFLLIFIQLPILIALYQIFLHSLSPEFFGGSRSFLGLINLEKGSILLVSLTAIAQYIQARLALPELVPGQSLSSAEKTSRQMVFLAPILTLLVFASLPAAVSLYWLTTSVFSIFQQMLINKQLDHGELGNIHEKNNRTSGIR